VERRLTMLEEQAAVRHFYETYGWEVGSSGRYRDAEAFVDPRPVLRGYNRRLARRLAGLLVPAPDGLLDIGCGGDPSPVGGDSATRWVCLDVASAALRGARQALGTRAGYVQADVCRLPFPDNTFSRVLCAHVLYHLTPRRQQRAIREIHRVLTDGGVAVVIYAQPSTPLYRLARRRRPAAEPDPGGEDDRPPLPYHPIDYHELGRRLAGHVAIEVRTFAMLEPDVTRAAIPDNVVGRALLAIASAAETVLARATLPLARYPMIVIRKRA